MKVTSGGMMVASAFLAAALVPAGCRAQTAPKAAAPIHWTTLDEPGSGGAMVGLAVSPYDSKRLLVSGDMLGVGISTDQGNSWQATFGFKTWEMADFTWHPKDPKVVWMGSMSGPYVSRDGGVNWAQMRAGMPAPAGFGYSVPIEKVLFDPADVHHLVAIGGSSRHWSSLGKPAWGAVWESHDDGQTWARLSTITKEGSSAAPDASGVNINFAAYVPGHPGALYAMADEAGFLTSADGGKTWTRRNTGLPPAGLGRVAVHPTNGNIVWVSVDNYKPAGMPRVPGGVFKSLDGGLTWKNSSTGLAQNANDDYNQCSHYRALAVAPSDPNVLYTNDNAFPAGVTYRSNDGGATWKPVVSKQNLGGDSNDPGKQKAFQLETACPAGLGLAGITVDPHNPNISYGYNTETIARSLDGKTWDDATSFHPVGSKGWRGRGYSGWCCTNFRFSNYTPGLSVLQGMDATRAWTSSDNLKSWVYNMYTPDAWGGGRDATFTKDGHIYVTTGMFNFTGIFRSTDGGNTWTAFSGEKHGLPDFYKNGTPMGIYALPDNSRIFACVNGKLLVSADSGETWKQIFDKPGLQWIAGDPKNPTSFYVSGDRNVYHTTDGATFTAVGGPHTNNGHIAVDSVGRLLAVGSESERAGLWRYDPKATGSKWMRLLDDRWITQVAVDSTDPDRIAVATNQNPYTEASAATGVWLTSDGGKSWSQENDGLAMTRVVTIAINPFDPTQLVAGTNGRGYWTAHWPKSPSLKGERAYVSSVEDAQFAEVKMAGPGAMPQVRNGDMTDGTTQPAGWDGKWVGKGQINPGRDTVTFKSAPASLVSSSGDEEAEGNVYEMIDVGENTTFTISGFLKTGGVAAQIAVQDFGGGWNAFGWQQAFFQNPNQDWTAFSKEITVPPGTAHVALVLWIKGKGKAWLDDVKITGVKMPIASP